MALVDKEIAQLEAFWAGLLNETDQLELENRLLSDADFSKEAAKIRLVTEGVNVLRQRRMRQQLIELDATLPPIEPSFTLPNWAIVSIVALATALAAFAVWHFGFAEQPEPKPSPMIAAHFKHYQDPDFERSGDKLENTATLARQTYNKRTYRKAIPLLEIAFQETRDSMLLFYQGISMLKCNESKKAKFIFEKIQNAQNIPKEWALWYLSLSYIEQNENDKARAILKTLITTERDPSTDAKALLHAIENK
jgi:hypothetical protein